MSDFTKERFQKLAGVLKEQAGELTLEDQLWKAAGALHVAKDLVEELSNLKHLLDEAQSEEWGQEALAEHGPRVVEDAKESVRELVKTVLD